MGYEITLKNIEIDRAAKQIGLEIAELRQQSGISYRTIFRETGVDYNSVKKIETGGDVMLKSYLKVYNFLKG